MRNANGLALVAALSLGVLLGIHAKGGSVVSETSAVPRSEGMSSADRARLLGKPEAQSATALEPQVDPRATHLVSRRFANGHEKRSVGVFGTCFDEATQTDRLPPEECVFTVEAVQFRNYTSYPLPGHALVNTVCVDLGALPEDHFGYEDDILPCSRVERDSLDFSIGIPLGVEWGAAGGVAAGIDAEATMSYAVEVDLGVSMPIHRRLRYPMVSASTGFNRMGGNILIDSGVGSIVARRSVVFGHTGFNGEVIVFVTKPVGMELWTGFTTSGAWSCSRGRPDEESAVCPDEFATALIRTCEIRNVGGCPTPPEPASASARLGTSESDFDIQELRDELDGQTETLREITDEVKVRAKEKIGEVFDLLKDHLADVGGNTAAVQRSVAVERIMSLLREKILGNLQEIRDIARETVTCPQ